MHVYGELKSHSRRNQDGCGVTSLNSVSDGPHAEDKENVGLGGKQAEGIQSRSAGKVSQRTVLADVTHQFVSHTESPAPRTGELAPGSAHRNGGDKLSAAVVGVERQAAANLRRMR